MTGLGRPTCKASFLLVELGRKSLFLPSGKRLPLPAIFFSSGRQLRCTPYWPPSWDRVLLFWQQKREHFSSPPFSRTSPAATSGSPADGEGFSFSRRHRSLSTSVLVRRRPKDRFADSNIGGLSLFFLVKALADQGGTPHFFPPCPAGIRAPRGLPNPKVETGPFPNRQKECFNFSPLSLLKKTSRLFSPEIISMITAAFFFFFSCSKAGFGQHRAAAVDSLRDMQRGSPCFLSALRSIKFTPTAF